MTPLTPNVCSCLHLSAIFLLLPLCVLSYLSPYTPTMHPQPPFCCPRAVLSTGAELTLAKPPRHRPTIRTISRPSLILWRPLSPAPPASTSLAHGCLLACRAAFSVLSALLSPMSGGNNCHQEDLAVVHQAPALHIVILLSDWIEEGVGVG